jgi:uncharacterized protein with von Willebrand factor type A (vWA) domain
VFDIRTSVRFAAEHTHSNMTQTNRASAARSDPSLARVILAFVHRLRDAGVPVSMVETLDAIGSLRHIELADRSQFRSTLAATLDKRVEHRGVFDSLFDIYFALQRKPPDVRTSLDRPGAGEGDSDGRGSDLGEISGEEVSTDFLEMLLRALRSGEQGIMQILAQVAVQQFAGITEDRSATERYYLYRVLRQLELSELLRRAILQEREDADARTPFLDRLIRDEQTRRVEEFRKLIAREIRHRLVELRGAAHAAQAFHDRPIEDVDFLTASPTELRQMRESIRPLTQKLAARIARRRRFRRHGRLDIRRTMRRSLQAGGVPLDPSFRLPKASKPDLYVLCDISGSVAEFARFTMSFLYALKEEFSKIRLFAFVDGIDEVTEAMREGSHQLAPRNLLYRKNVIQGDGHSDHGNVFRRFWHVYGHAALDPRATVIVTGDARNNFRDPGGEMLREISERARKLYWLNPEPRAQWNTGDSIVDAYASMCTGVFEARNLRQLGEFVYQIT